MRNSRIKLLIVIPDLAGGTGLFSRSLGAGLRQFHREQFDVSLLTLRNVPLSEEDRAAFDQTYDLDLPVYSNWRRLYELPMAIHKLRRKVRQLGPDLVFTVHVFSNVIASLAIKDVPVVLSDHLNMTHRLTGVRFGALTSWFMRRAYPRRLMIIASEELEQNLRQNFGVTRSLTIPNGIDLSVVRARSQQRPASLECSRYFVAVGRLTEQKDFSTLLRAHSVARSQGLDHDLVIAGDGEERAMLESLSRELGISDHVHFLGHCPNPYPLIKASRALVLSSIWEGFAYAPIEAMALGVPVMSTACPSGPADILGGGEFGILVPPRDPQHLADAMLRLSRDNALHQHLSKKSFERAAQLSIEHMAYAYRDAFSKEAALP